MILPGFSSIGVSRGQSRLIKVNQVSTVLWVRVFGVFRGENKKITLSALSAPLREAFIGPGPAAQWPRIFSNVPARSLKILPPGGKPRGGVFGILPGRILTLLRLRAVLHPLSAKWGEGQGEGPLFSWQCRDAPIFCPD
jgi:hypothetical protein